MKLLTQQDLAALAEERYPIENVDAVGHVLALAKQVGFIAGYDAAIQAGQEREKMLVEQRDYWLRQTALCNGDDDTHVQFAIDEDNQALKAIEKSNV